jgi:hypothetical protein
MEFWKDRRTLPLIWVHSRKSEIFTGERAGQFSQYSPNLACLGSR